VEPAAETLRLTTVNEEASDCALSRSSWARIAGRPVRSSSCPVPIVTTSESGANNDITASRFRSRTSSISASVRGSAFIGSM